MGSHLRFLLGHSWRSNFHKRTYALFDTNEICECANEAGRELAHLHGRGGRGGHGRLLVSSAEWHVGAVPAQRYLLSDSRGRLVLGVFCGTADLHSMPAGGAAVAQ